MSISPVFNVAAKVHHNHRHKCEAIISLLIQGELPELSSAGSS